MEHILSATQTINIEYKQAKNLREYILLQFFAAIGPLHNKLYKHRLDWQISTKILLAYPPNSLGHTMGLFLHTQNLEPIARAERHDVFHVLLQYGTEVYMEAGMQCCLLGAGKKSPSVLATIALALVFLPEHWRYFYQQYQRGKELEQFYKWPLHNMLNCNIANLRHSILKRKN